MVQHRFCFTPDLGACLSSLRQVQRLVARHDEEVIGEFPLRLSVDSLAGLASPNSVHDYLILSRWLELYVSVVVLGWHARSFQTSMTRTHAQAAYAMIIHRTMHAIATTIVYSKTKAWNIKPDQRLMIRSKGQTCVDLWTNSVSRFITKSLVIYNYTVRFAIEKLGEADVSIPKRPYCCKVAALWLPQYSPLFRWCRPFLASPI